MTKRELRTALDVAHRRIDELEARMHALESTPPPSGHWVPHRLLVQETDRRVKAEQQLLARALCETEPA